MKLNQLIKRLQAEQSKHYNYIVEVWVGDESYEITEVVEDFDDEYVKLKTRKAR